MDHLECFKSLKEVTSAEPDSARALELDKLVTIEFGLFTRSCQPLDGLSSRWFRTVGGKEFRLFL